MLTVVTWLWTPKRRYRSDYQPFHVEQMKRMVSRHCTLEHEFVCVTDRPQEAFGPGIRAVPIWTDHQYAAPAFPAGPSCYRRLRIFSREANRLLAVAPRSTVVSIDIDAIITGSVDKLWDRDEDFVGWRASDRAPTCGSMFLHKLGTLPRVWEEFEPGFAVEESKRTGYVGTDQAWMARCLCDDYGGWTTEDGVYSFKMHCEAGLPGDARVVFFHGKPDPWDQLARKHAWVRESYPLESPRAA